MYRILKIIFSKFGMGIHLTIDFMFPSWFADTICVLTKKFWGIDEKLPEEAET